MSVVLLGDLRLMERPGEDGGVVVLVDHTHYHPRLAPGLPSPRLHHKLVLQEGERAGAGDFYLAENREANGGCGRCGPPPHSSNFVPSLSAPTPIAPGYGKDLS